MENLTSQDNVDKNQKCSVKFGLDVNDAKQLVNDHTKRKNERLTDKSIFHLAEKRGYFLRLTIDNLIENSSTIINESDKINSENNQLTDLNLLVYAHLSNLKIHNIALCEFCANLTILNVANNYVAAFDSLISCEKLEKLDLSGNHIEELPGMAFWNNLSRLNILFMHNNPIGSTNAIDGLSAAQNLTVLTLYDTPLSLKVNYRHHMVNSVWSLKVLDNHVISDEEIIEDAQFSYSNFQALSPNFQIDTYFQLTQKNLEEERLKINALFRKINRIQSHFSPVLILQRFFRGLLVRHSHRLRRPSPVTTVAAGADVTGDVTGDIEVPTHFDAPAVALPPLPAHTPQNQEASGAPAFVAAEPAAPVERDARTSDQNDAISPIKSTRVTSPSAAAAPYLEGPVSNEPANHAVISTTHLTNYWRPDSRVGKDDDEIPKISFRLEGFSSELTHFDPMVELIMSKAESGRMIRDAEHHFHKVLIAQRERREHETALEKERRERASSKKKLKDGRLFQQVQGSMGLAMLRKWDGVDDDIDRMARLQQKANSIAQQKEVNHERRCIAQHVKQQNRDLCKFQRDRERKLNELQIDRHRVIAQQTGDESVQKRKEEREHEKKRAHEIHFSRQFCSQQNSVSKALLNHDKKAIRDDFVKLNRQFVQDSRDRNQHELDTIKKYLEQQRVARQTEILIQKSMLASKLFEQSQTRIHDARANVDNKREEMTARPSKIFKNGRVQMAAESFAIVPQQLAELDI